jgi:hypothetical protein
MYTIPVPFIAPDINDSIIWMFFVYFSGRPKRLGSAKKFASCAVLIAAEPPVLGLHVFP